MLNASDNNAAAIWGCPDSIYMDALPVGFHLSQDNVHLEIVNDSQDNPRGTGVAYIQFSSSDTAEEARKSKHKQSMGTRYIECMTLTSGPLPPPPALLHEYSSHQDAHFCCDANAMHSNMTKIAACFFLQLQYMLSLSYVLLLLHMLFIQQSPNEERQL